MTGKVLLLRDTNGRVARALTAIGCTVANTSSLTELRECIQRFQPDLLVLSSADAEKFLSGDDRPRRPPLIFVLGNTNRSDEAITALECGADDFVPVGTGSPELAARASSLLRSIARLSSAAPASAHSARP